MRLTGESVFTLRLTSALVGVLTVAMVVWMGKEIARKLSTVNDQLAIGNWQFTIDHSLFPLLLAILLATHFPHLIFSRLGFRAVTQPLLQGLTVAATLHGLRTRKIGSFIAAGVFLGLTGYTYLAARLFPVLFGLFLLPLMQRWWRQIGLILGTAFAIFAPLGWFFWQNPETFWVRIGQVGGSDTQLDDYANSFVRSLLMLGLDGDPYWRFNIPGRPLLELGWFVAWLVGIGFFIWWLPKARGGKLASLLLLLATPLIMILPTALALDEIVPSNLRAIGLYPFVLVPVALVLTLVAQQLPTLGREAVAPVLLGTSLLLAGIVYFDEWGTRSDTFYDSDADLVALAAYVDERAAGYDEIYVGSQHYRHPTMAFASATYDRVKWLVGSNAVVLPEGKRGLLAFPQSSPPPEWLMEFEPLEAPIGPDDKVLFWVWNSAEITPPSPDNTTTYSPNNVPTFQSTNFSSIINLDGYSLLNAGTTNPTLQLHWTVFDQPDRNFAPFVHIEDQTGYRWLQVETIAYPAEQWEKGEQIVQYVPLSLPAGMPQSRPDIDWEAYRLVIGLFEDEDRMPLVDETGQFAGNTVQTFVQLAGNGAQPNRAPDIVLNEEVFPGVTLVGYDESVASAETGQQVSITLYWQNEVSVPTVPYMVALFSPTTYLATAAAVGFLPTQSTEPFSTIQNLSLDVTEYAESGPLGLSLRVRFVDQATYDGEFSEALLKSDFDNAVKMGELTVIPVDRLFEPPSIQIESNANLGNEIALSGYAMTQSSNSSFTLSLVWQALGDISADYTVFVHVLNPDGTCCIWQQDAMPKQNSYPTSRWVAGEYVIDGYTIEFDGEARRRISGRNRPCIAPKTASGYR